MKRISSLSFQLIFISAIAQKLQNHCRSEITIVFDLLAISSPFFQSLLQQTTPRVPFRARSAPVCSDFWRTCMQNRGTIFRKMSEKWWFQPVTSQVIRRTSCCSYSLNWSPPVPPWQGLITMLTTLLPLQAGRTRFHISTAKAPKHLIQFSTEASIRGKFE